MTLGECLEQIKQIYLDNSIERMTKIRSSIKDEIDRRLPVGASNKRGWKVFFTEDVPYLINGQIRIKVNIKPEVAREKVKLIKGRINEAYVKTKEGLIQKTEATIKTKDKGIAFVKHAQKKVKEKTENIKILRS